MRPEASVPLSGGSVAIEAGAVNPRPFHVNTLPLLSTRTQKVVVAHETEFSWPCASASLGWVQLWPLKTVGPALGSDAEGGRDAGDLVGGAPRSEVARPARPVEGKGVALAVDGDAERGRRCSRWR